MGAVKPRQKQDCGGCSRACASRGSKGRYVLRMWRRLWQVRAYLSIRGTFQAWSTWSPRGDMLKQKYIHTCIHTCTRMNDVSSTWSPRSNLQMCTLATTRPICGGNDAKPLNPKLSTLTFMCGGKDAGPHIHIFTG